MGLVSWEPRAQGWPAFPPQVIDRGKEVLNNLEQGEFTEGGVPKLAASRKKKATWDSHQMTLFQKPPEAVAGNPEEGRPGPSHAPGGLGSFE